MIGPIRSLGVPCALHYLAIMSRWGLGGYIQDLSRLPGISARFTKDPLF